MAFAFSSVVDNDQLYKRLKKIIKVFKSNPAPVLSKFGLHDDLVQTFLYYDNMGKGDPLLTQMISSAALTAEHKAAGAGKLFLEIFLSQIEDDIKQKNIKNKIDTIWNDIKDSLSSKTSQCSKSELFDYLKNNLDDTTFNIVYAALQMSFINDKLKVKKGIANKTTINRSSGYRFTNLYADSQFLKNGIWKKTNCRIILIDGVIESVGEIYRLLEQQSQDKTPCIIFCINVLDDVKNTIIHNFQRSALDVIIIPVPVDITHVNTMVDLGIVTQTAPICAAKGETISMAADYQKQIVKCVTVEKGVITIENPNADDDILKHLKLLEEKLTNDPNSSQIFQSRIDTLSCKNLIVTVGSDDLKKQPQLIEKLDNTFRSIQNIIFYGFIEKDSLKMFPFEKIGLLFKGGMDKEPIFKIIQAINIFESTRSAITSTGTSIQYTNT